MQQKIIKMDLSEEIQKIAGIISRDNRIFFNHADTIAVVGLTAIAQTYILYSLEEMYGIVVKNRPVYSNERALFGYITNCLNTIHYSVYGGFTLPYGVEMSCTYLYERATLSLTFELTDRRIPNGALSF